MLIGLSGAPDRVLGNSATEPTGAGPLQEAKQLNGKPKGVQNPWLLINKVVWEEVK